MVPGILDDLLGAQLFGYITFRVAAAALTAFVLALSLGGPTIRWLRANKFLDPEKEELRRRTDIPAHAAKALTPTLGGSFLIVSLLTSVLLWGRLDNLHVVLAVLLTAGLAAVGFVDDFWKLTRPKAPGLTKGAKMLGLSLVTLGALFALVFHAQTTGRPALLHLYPPFFKDLVIPLGSLGLIGIALFLAFQWLVVVGTSNAANITDGLDGLAAGCLLMAGLALSIFCYVSGRYDWTGYLLLPHVPAASEMAVVGGALCGACLGFLWFNAHPAQVFMGDSGSLPLGGLLAWMALVSKQELVLPLIAGVLYLELGSSFLQTFWYRRSGGRRLFTCAPLHHGLERFGGIFRPGPRPWHEVTVVVRAWIVAAACALLSLALLKVR